MNIGILGSGIVGQQLGHALAQARHQVTLGTRTPEQLHERRGQGTSLQQWLDTTPNGKVTHPEQAVEHADLVINATNGQHSLEALEQVRSQLQGKILLDVSVPAQFHADRPPTLFVKDTDSLAEQIQRAHPDTRVVKSLNTTFVNVMVNPKGLAGGDHTVFLSGNSPEAKATVRRALQDLGWEDILDLGDITTARGQEMQLALGARVWRALGTNRMQFKVVRELP